MNRTFLFSLVLIVTFALLPAFTNAQSDVDLEKKWSRVTADKNPAINIISDYKYIQGPPVYQKYDLGETDALVMPNYRVFPGTNSTQSELSIDIHPLNANIMFAGANATNWPYSTIYGTGVYWTTNGGTTWGGANNPQPLFGSTNYGDPSSAIGTNGYFYEGYITLAGGMGVAKSTNNGAN
ncbi:MAG: hypothetical protein Q8M94_03950, partial [Ignavibacteria bacterium]|nr:hypothetical protein [Ignavibacteria bacterium]